MSNCTLAGHGRTASERFAALLRLSLALAMVLWLAYMPPAAAASLSGRDVQIIAKALAFLDPAPAGGLVAVAYAPGDAASEADADAIVALFGGGLASAGGTVAATKVAAGAVLGGGRYIAVIFAAGAEAAASTLRGVLSITAADALVRSGSCVMAVHSLPRVDIIVNRAAAEAAGISFTAAFGMLVHEI